MNCFGKYDYNREECLKCERRIECMIKKFESRETDEWFDSSDRPSCFGSYKGKDCQECPYKKECTRTSVEIKRDLERKGRKIRIQGKYKERGSWKRGAGY